MAWAGRLERKHRWRVVAFLLVGTLLFAGLRANPNAVRHDFWTTLKAAFLLWEVESYDLVRLIKRRMQIPFLTLTFRIEW